MKQKILTILLFGTFLHLQSDAASPRLVMIVGESEYRTWETLPEFARTELEPQGWAVDWVQSSTKDADMAFTNVEAIARADLLLVSTRRRTPPARMMELIRAHLEKGKPLAGIRTASHAFALRTPALAEGQADWVEFDREVLGADYLGHFGEVECRLQTEPSAIPHPVLVGIPPEWTTPTKLYKAGNLQASARVLVWGNIAGEPSRQPVAWTNLSGKSRVFYTSLGGPDDFKHPAFRRLLRNGLTWCLEEKTRALRHPNHLYPLILCTSSPLKRSASVKIGLLQASRYGAHIAHIAHIDRPYAKQLAVVAVLGTGAAVGTAHAGLAPAVGAHDGVGWKGQIENKFSVLGQTPPPPRLANGGTPLNLVEQFGGHADVNRSLSGLLGNSSNNRLGFSMTLDDAGNFGVGWNSRTINLGNPSFPGYTVPEAMRQQVLDAIMQSTGRVAR